MGRDEVQNEEEQKGSVANEHKNNKTKQKCESSF